MKKHLIKFACFFLFIITIKLNAQENYCTIGCNDNSYMNSADPNTLEYDNMISLFHSSMVREVDGTVKVWGQAISNTGGNVAPPQKLDSINYPALRGKILKFAGGSASAASGGAQFVVLTTKGLFVWGTANNLVSTTIKSDNTLGSVSIGTSGVPSTNNDSYSMGLPHGVKPEDVKMLFGSYRTLAITTCDGRVFVLSGQGNKNGGGTNTTADQIVWHQVRKSSAPNDFLTNVVATRGTPNALFALTADGRLYTWGTGTYINNGGPIHRAYATEISLPIAGVTPKMIGMTQSSASAQTYYLLTTDGDLFAMGANDKKQLGIGNATASTTWVRPRKVTDQYGQGIGDLKDIQWISPNEHDNGNHAAINVLTNEGKLWAWGSNDGNMIGGPDTHPTYNNYDPIYMPGKITGAYDLGKLNVSDVLMAVETGGHTTIAVKQCSKKFGYVGHKTNGSMGDNTSGTGRLNTYDFENTVDLVVCGAASTPMTEEILPICEDTFADLSHGLISSVPAGYDIEWWTTIDRTPGTEVADPTNVDIGDYYAFFIPQNTGACENPEGAKVTVRYFQPDDEGHETCLKCYENIIGNDFSWSSTSQEIDDWGYFNHHGWDGFVNDWNNGVIANPEAGSPLEIYRATTSQPGSTGGFVFDIFALDNSFNMEINGTKLSVQELQFQYESDDQIPGNVEFLDGTHAGNGMENIWELYGDIISEKPIIRVVIDANGAITLYGSKVSYDDPAYLLEEMKLTNGNSFNIMTWYESQDNEVIVSQLVADVTMMVGVGYGRLEVPCGSGDLPCVNSALGGSPNGFTKVGITTQAKQANWPNNVPNGFIALESKDKGMVISRVASDAVIADPKEGMLIYDMAAACVKLYNGTVWNCIKNTCE